MKRGQSALEYLMTYGWAIIIIAIVGSALFFLGVFNPIGFAGVNKQIIGFSSFLVEGFMLDTQGKMNITLDNRFGAKVTVTEINVTIDGASQKIVLNEDIEQHKKKSFLITGLGSFSDGSTFRAEVLIRFKDRFNYFSLDKGTILGIVVSSS